MSKFTFSFAYLTRMYHHVTEVHAHCQPSSFVFAWTDTFARDSNIIINDLFMSLKRLQR